MTVRALIQKHHAEAIFERYGFFPTSPKEDELLLELADFEGLVLDEIPITGKVVEERLSPYARDDGDQIKLTGFDRTEGFSFFQQLESFLNTLLLENLGSPFFRSFSSSNTPAGLKLPKSAELLDRLTRDRFYPKEKKEAVVDLGRSSGAYLGSIDTDPLVIFDSASQIASVGAGFSADPFEKALDENVFTEALIENPAPEHPLSIEATSRFSDFLKKHASPSLKYTTFVASGAEANEKAFDLCRLNGPGGKRVIAFEGSFHGRTSLALMATYNPIKRAGFEFSGYEARYAPFPTWDTPGDPEPEVSKEWITAWKSGSIPQADPSNTLLQSEISSLTKVKEAIEQGDVCAVIVEPMQCEGGDCYATARFFNGLRALTRGCGVPLIIDEVQSAFCLLGPFFAHTHFQLKDEHGNPDSPDCVTLAKKAQLGIVLSCFPDERPSVPHVVQAQRGLIQAQALSAADPLDTQTIVANELCLLSEKYPGEIINPRGRGYAFAFDMKDGKTANTVIAERFKLGFMAYIAGEKTVRFRMNLSCTAEVIKGLFRALDVAIFRVLEGGNSAEPNKSSPKHRLLPNPRIPQNIAIQTLSWENFNTLETQFQHAESIAYEPGRQDSIAFLRSFFAQENHVCLAILKQEPAQEVLLGYCFGGPLENSEADGPLQDTLRGKNNTFYSANVLVDKSLQGKGFGHLLKRAQLQAVRAENKSDGTPRYDFICGRNRLGATDAIHHINQSMGAYHLATYDQQYGQSDAKAEYYRIPLRRPKAQHLEIAKKDRGDFDFRIGLQRPLSNAPELLLKEAQEGAFTTCVGTKLTLSNFITPNYVRYAELLKAVAPKGLPHAFFTSGRDEVADKGIRALRFHRKVAQFAVGLTKQFLGTGTAVSRSLTDPSEFKKPFSFYDWPMANHPQEVGAQESLKELREIIASKNASDFLGIVLELVGEKTGYVLDKEFLDGCNAIRQETGIPLIFVENASALGRNGKTLFLSDQCGFSPNMVWWFTGGQLGHVFTDDEYYVEKPLTLISTWDGDEISILRNYRHIVEARHALERQTFLKWEAKLSILKAKIFGTGGFHGILFEDALTLHRTKERLRDLGLLLDIGFNNTLIIAPPLTLSASDIDAASKRLLQGVVAV